MPTNNIKKYKKKHKHYWSVEHLVYEGRTPSEMAIHRYCQCGVHQVGYVSRFYKPSKRWDMKMLKDCAK